MTRGNARFLEDLGEQRVLLVLGPGPFGWMIRHVQRPSPRNETKRKKERKGKERKGKKRKETKTKTSQTTAGQGEDSRQEQQHGLKKNDELLTRKQKRDQAVDGQAAGTRDYHTGPGFIWVFFQKRSKAEREKYG